MKILFIGNSKTYRQNMPNILKKLIEATGKEVYIDKATKPGASLIDLYNEKDTIEKINSNKWDYVVIQERTIKSLQEDTSEFEKGARDICDKILENYVETKIVYNAVGVYCDFNIEEYERTDKHYEEIAKITNGMDCYSGKAFIDFHRKFSDIDLFEDKQHPTLVGAYLTACCLYKLIYKEKLSSIDYYDVLNPDIAKNLQNLIDTI